MSPKKLKESPNKYMKRCSTSLLGKWKVSWYIYDISRCTCQNGHIRETRDEKCQWQCAEKGSPVLYRWNYKLVQPLQKTGWKMVKKLKPELQYDPAIPLPRIYPKRVKANWKRYLHPHVQGNVIYNSQVMETTPVSTSWWMDKVWDICRSIKTYICTHTRPHTRAHTYRPEYYSAIKNEELQPFVTMWSLEWSQMKKTNGVWSPLYLESKKTTKLNKLRKRDQTYG